MASTIREVIMRILGLTFLVTICVAASAAAGDEPGAAKKFWVYIGTYTNAKSKGIYRGELDAQTGKLTNIQLAAQTPSPSFLAIHPKGTFLYAVGESGGKGGGTVSAFALDRKTG